MNIEVRKQIAQILIDWKALVGAIISATEPPETKYHMLAVRSGICANILNNIEEGDFDVFEMELDEMFRDDGLHIMFPFNGGAQHYYMECDTDSIHLNAARVAWVDKIIAQYG